MWSDRQTDKLCAIFLTSSLSLKLNIYVCMADILQKLCEYGNLVFGLLAPFLIELIPRH